MYSTCEEIKLKKIVLRVYLRLYCRSLQENTIVLFYLIMKSDFASPIVSILYFVLFVKTRCLVNYLTIFENKYEKAFSINERCSH